ncbi:MAG: hypothetical protein LBT00_09690 [Spirochaetaceae bacterium]|nr:hypothetical protein [Spirochaetaceae bacterium]
MHTVLDGCATDATYGLKATYYHLMLPFRVAMPPKTVCNQPGQQYQVARLLGREQFRERPHVIANPQGEAIQTRRLSYWIASLRSQ